jgi:catechol 2,3-dioxygenase-like lactoylglutathione lyase family enzyme
MKVKFVAGFGPLVRDREASLAFYRETLGLPLRGEEYVSANELEGVGHFGQWHIDDAAGPSSETRVAPGPADPSSQHRV